MILKFRILYYIKCSSSSNNARGSEHNNVVGMVWKRYKELGNVRALERRNADLQEKLYKRDDDDMMEQAQKDILGYCAL